QLDRSVSSTTLEILLVDADPAATAAADRGVETGARPAMPTAQSGAASQAPQASEDSGRVAQPKIGGDGASASSTDINSVLRFSYSVDQFGAHVDRYSSLGQLLTDLAKRREGPFVPPVDPRPRRDQPEPQRRD